MSDGVEEEKKKREGDTNPDKSVACPDEYSQAVARVAVAQICEGIGFEGVKNSALDAFSDIIVRYICNLAESGRYYSNLAGRSESNVFDIVKGLEDLSAIRVFVGAASAFDSCLTSSGALKKLVDYVATVEEIPFAKPIPQFLVSSSTRSSCGIHSSSELREVPNRKHIPDWLPEFPEPHTYLHSSVWNERRADTRTDNTEHVKQRRKAESSLLRLQQRLLACTSGPSMSTNGADDVERSESVEGNLFLAPSLPPGEREVSQVFVPTKLVSTGPNKKHGSFVDMFAPTTDAVKGRDVDSMEVDRGLAFEKRPVVHFRLKKGKKMRSKDVDVSLRSRGEERVLPLGLDEERDEKKRRAHQILWQSMGSAQETGNNVN